MRRGKALTLIELLVVISIVVLLVSILIPTVQLVRRQAKAAMCKGNLRQWGAILAMYTEENKGWLPSDHIRCIWLMGNSQRSDDDLDMSPVYHGFNTQDIALCPMAVRIDRNNRWYDYLDVVNYDPKLPNYPKYICLFGTAFEAWEITSPSPSRLFRGSYGFNNWRVIMSGDIITRPVTWFRCNIYSIKGRSNIPALVDSTGPWTVFHELNDPPLTDTRDMETAFSLINRHNGFVKGLFLDWSVRKIGLKELWTLKWHPDFNTSGPWTKAGGVLPEDWPEWMRKFKDY